MRTNLSPYLSLTFLLLAPGLLAQAPSFDGRTADEWAKTLQSDANADRRLAAGGAAAVPVIEALLASGDATVVERAAAASSGLGAAGAPLREALLKILAKADSWWTRLYAARALGAAGTRDAEVLNALAVGCDDDGAAHLRQVCAQALWKLDPSGTALLERVATGGFKDHERAIDALRYGDEAAIPRLVATLAGEDALAKRTAEEAIVRIGWRAVPDLEAAKRQDLALRALHEGPLVHVRLGDGQRVEYEERVVKEPRELSFTFEFGSGHGGDLELTRAWWDGELLRFDEIELTGPTVNEVERPFRITVRTAALPEPRASAFVRQLVALTAAKVVVDPNAKTGESWHSSGDFHARLRMERGAEAKFDERWAGQPSSSRAAEYFRVRAAASVLDEALRGAAWTTRAADAQDKERVGARIGAKHDGEPRWVIERLEQIAKSLRPAK